MAARAFHFSFWQQKEKQKQKERLPAALFWLFPRLFPLNKKNSLRSNSFLFLTLQQPPPFHAKKDEAGTLAQHCFARCSLMFSCSLVARYYFLVRSLLALVILRNEVTKDLSTSPKDRSNILQPSAGHPKKRAKQRLVIIHPSNFRHEWRSVKKFVRFSVKKKKLFER